MGNRYQIFKGSSSGHCCFTTSVMDTTKPHIIGGKHYERDGQKHYDSICECFEVEDAKKIIEALNESSEPWCPDHGCPMLIVDTVCEQCQDEHNKKMEKR